MSQGSKDSPLWEATKNASTTEEATISHDSDLEGETLKMPNISQGILDDLLPSQEGSQSRSKMSPTAGPRSGHAAALSQT